MTFEKIISKEKQIMILFLGEQITLQDCSQQETSGKRETRYVRGKGVMLRKLVLKLHFKISFV